MHLLLVWCKSDNGQTVPPSNRESHSLKQLSFTSYIYILPTCCISSHHTSNTQFSNTQVSEVRLGWTSCRSYQSQDRCHLPLLPLLLLLLQRRRWQLRQRWLPTTVWWRHRHRTKAANIYTIFMEVVCQSKGRMVWVVDKDCTTMQTLCSHGTQHLCLHTHSNS